MISYIPVLTTLFSVFFLGRIIPHYLSKRSPYLLWWTLGVLTFGLGTLTESINAIFGWTGSKMASLYTQNADRKRLAKDAIDKLLVNESATSIPSPKGKVRAAKRK